MSELFDENKTVSTDEENNISEEKEESSMSLDDRKEQLENKVNKEMGESEPKPENEGKTQSKVKSPNDSPPTVGYIHNSPSNRMPLPKMNDTPRNSGSSYDVYNNYNNGYYSNYYGRTTERNRKDNMNSSYYPSYSPYANQTHKEKMNAAAKSYLIVIIGITVIFILGFILECVNTYSENGIFGGEDGILSKDFDKYLDTDYDFGFKFNEDSDDENDKDSEDNDSDNVFDFIDKGDSDNDVKNLKDAPDEKTVINKEAANIKAVDQPEDIDSANYSARQAFKKVENSVVNVVVYDGEIGNDEYAVGTGSGIIISEDGYIVTNSHVIGDTKQYNVEIITTSGDSYVAVIVGYDSRTDLAVLKIDGTDLTAAEFVNSDQIEVGQDAIAVGNPGGIDYSNSLTRGCVSAINRTVSSNRLVPYIQTDAAINPGNSGGPLLNSAGQVMGITTIKIASSEYEGMGFAISSNTVVSIANDLIGQGYVSNRVRIGITGVEVTEEIFTSTPSGIRIDDFSEDSPFKATDAKVKDVITAVNGTPIETFTELFSELDNYSPGDKITVTLYRGATSSTNSKTFDVEIELLADNGETQR